MTTDLGLRLDALRHAYASIGGPAAEQWDLLESVPADRPVTLLNLFEFRDAAGQEAFGRYAAVSATALESVGGRFVHLGSHVGNLVGSDESWDLVVVGEYPNVDAVLALHEDAAYQEAYRHRVAACARQQVLVSV